MPELKLGRKPRAFDPAMPHYSSLRMGVQLPPPPPSVNWMEGKNIEWRMMLNDSLGDCTCFPAGARIRMADGGSKPIEQIKVGDQVLTAERNISQVTNSMSRHTKEGVVRVVAWGLSHLRLTSEHPVLTTRGYIKAGALTENDWIVCPVWKPLFEGESIDGSVFNHQGKWRKQPVPDLIDLTPGIGRLLGLYLAEGSTDQKAIVRWTFGPTEEKFAIEVQTILMNEMNTQSSITVRKGGVFDVTLCGSHWKLFFDTLCGKGAYNKKIHPDLWRGDDDFFRALLKGWLDGDGHHRRKETAGTTVSRALAHDMYSVAAVLGLRPAINCQSLKNWSVIIRDERSSEWDNGGASFDKKNDRWVANTDQQYLGSFKTKEDAVIAVREWKTEHGRFADGKTCVQDGVILRRVRKVQWEYFDGVVYNFSVAGDNSYVADGVGVHNCAGFYHQMQVWSAHGRNQALTEPDRIVLKMYEEFCGYQPGNPNTDQGGVEQDIIHRALVTGVPIQEGVTKAGQFGRSKIKFACEIDRRNHEDVMHAINNCGCVYIGFNVPRWLMSGGNVPEVWDQGGDNSIEGGHCVILPGYDANGPFVVSWGAVYQMTWRFFDQFTDEVYAMAHPWWIDATGKTPLNMNLETLEHLMTAFAHSRVTVGKKSSGGKKTGGTGKKRQRL